MASKFLTPKRQVSVFYDFNTQPDMISGAIMVHGGPIAASMRIRENHSRTVALAKGINALCLVCEKKDPPAGRLPVDNIEVSLKTDSIVGFSELVGTPDVHRDDWSTARHLSTVKLVNFRENFWPQPKISVGHETIDFAEGLAMPFVRFRNRCEQIRQMDIEIADRNRFTSAQIEGTGQS